jgi:hypothetical protein
VLLIILKAIDDASQEDSYVVMFSRRTGNKAAFSSICEKIRELLSAPIVGNAGQLHSAAAV